MLVSNLSKANAELKSQSHLSDKSMTSDRKDISKISSIDKTFNNEMRSMNST
jgi:hypothetical protein